MNTFNPSGKPTEEFPMDNGEPDLAADKQTLDALDNDEARINARMIAGFMGLIQVENAEDQDKAYKELESLDGVVPEVTKTLEQTRDSTNPVASLRKRVLDKISSPKLQLSDASDFVGYSEDRLMLAAEQGDITCEWDENKIPVFRLGDLDALSKRLKEDGL
jgi:hypothetical protein